MKVYTFDTLKKVTVRFDSCQRTRPAQVRFRFSIRNEHIWFNELVQIDITYLFVHRVLDVVDCATHFSAAKVLPNASSDLIFSTLRTYSTATYTVMLHRARIGQGTSFGTLFKSLASQFKIIVDQTGIEARSSLNICDNYHQPLRKTYHKLNIAYPDKECCISLAKAVKAMNETLEPKGIVSSSLFFLASSLKFLLSSTIFLSDWV